MYTIQVCCKHNSIRNEWTCDTDVLSRGIDEAKEALDWSGLEGDYHVRILSLDCELMWDSRTGCQHRNQFVNDRSLFQCTDCGEELGR